jgi:hypothetical protein
MVFKKRQNIVCGVYIRGSQSGLYCPPGGRLDYLGGRWRWAPPSALFAYLRLTRLEPRAKHLPRYVFKVLLLLSLSKLFPLVTFVCIYDSELSQDSQLLVIAIDFLIN